MSMTNPTFEESFLANMAEIGRNMAAEMEATEPQPEPAVDVELKPCPFCESNPRMESWYSPPRGYWFSCDGCSVEADSAIDKAGAAEAWNHRPIEDAQTKRIAELEARISHLEERLERANWERHKEMRRS